MGKHHKKSNKWTKITATPKQKSTTPHEKTHKKKRRHRSLGKLNKIGKGVVKRTDSIGKFTGGIIKNQSNAIANVTNAFSNPIVLLGAGAIALFIILKK